MADRETSRGKGPVPVRETLRRPAPTAAAADAADAADVGSSALEARFELDGEEWIARSSGAGSYGTGRLGEARLAAIHFARADAPERPVREALIPASSFGSLFPSELRALFGAATPIDLDRDG